jgi:hypothetical protein
MEEGVEAAADGAGLDEDLRQELMKALSWLGEIVIISFSIVILVYFICKSLIYLIGILVVFGCSSWG